MLRIAKLGVLFRHFLPWIMHAIPWTPFVLVCMGWTRLGWALAWFWLWCCWILPKMQHCRRSRLRPSLARRVRCGQDIAWLAGVTVFASASALSPVSHAASRPLASNECAHLYLINIFYLPHIHWRIRALWFMPGVLCSLCRLSVTDCNL